MKPLQLWACQEVASMISARPAPFARRSKPRMVSVLVPWRTPSAFGSAAFDALVAVLAGVAFLGLAPAPALGLAPLAFFAALGGPFFWVAFFFEGAFSGATAAPCAPMMASLVVFSMFSVVIFVFCPFAVTSASWTFITSVPP